MPDKHNAHIIFRGIFA